MLPITFESTAISDFICRFSIVGLEPLCLTRLSNDRRQEGVRSEGSLCYVDGEILSRRTNRQRFHGGFPRMRWWKTVSCARKNPQAKRNSDTSLRHRSRTEDAFFERADGGSSRE